MFVPLNIAGVFVLVKYRPGIRYKPWGTEVTWLEVTWDCTTTLELYISRYGDSIHQVSVWIQTWSSEQTKDFQVYQHYLALIHLFLLKILSNPWWMMMWSRSKQKVLSVIDSATRHLARQPAFILLPWAASSCAAAPPSIWMSIIPRGTITCGLPTPAGGC